MLYKLLRQLDTDQFAPSVFCLGGMDDFGPRILELGVPVTSLNLRPGPSFFYGMMKLTKFLKQTNQDVVHTWMYHSDLLGGIAARLAGVKHIVWGIRHTDLSLTKNKATTLAVVWVCAFASRWLPSCITVNSRVARDVHIRAGYFANKMVVIPNGFDIELFRPRYNARAELREILGLPHKNLVVGLIGRYHPQKNHLGFVEAMNSVHAIHPDVHFVLVGKGVDHENRELENSLERFQVRNNVHLLGLRRDVHRLIAGLDVLALPSIGEAFPNVVGEAMACGVPCAVCDVGDVAWILGGCGEVAKHGDMEDLALALLKLIELPYSKREEIGTLARERVSNYFEIGKVVRQYEELYSRCISSADHCQL